MREDRAMASTFDWLVTFFAGEQWKFASSAQQQTVSFVFDGKAGPWTTYVKAFDAEQQIAVYGVLPFTIEDDQRLAAAELITRINHGLVIGNFEMDFGDGEVRYKTSLDFEGEVLTDKLVIQLVRANLAIVDSYLPAFIAMAIKRLTAVAALALVE
jgi:hypothetical protein